MALSKATPEEVENFFDANRDAVLRLVLDKHLKFTKRAMNKVLIYICKGHGLQVEDQVDTVDEWLTGSSCQCREQYCSKCQTKYQTHCVVCNETYCRGTCGDDVESGGKCNDCRGVADRS